MGRGQGARDPRLAKLRSAVANDDEAAEKELDKLLSDHAEHHLDMILLAKLPIRAGTDIFIVDLLHALNLNVAKTAWKYSYGDRMLEKQRLQAARHLNSIGIPLDVRAKGKRNPEQKWFSSSQFDGFVLGREHLGDGGHCLPANCRLHSSSSAASSRRSRSATATAARQPAQGAHAIASEACSSNRRLHRLRSLSTNSSRSTTTSTASNHAS